VFIANRLTARKARNFIYGSKETKRLASVIGSNMYVEECMTYLRPEPEPEYVTITTSSKYSFVIFAFCISISVVIVMLYTVYGQVLYKFKQF
jgi:hypothetical protein